MHGWRHYEPKQRRAVRRRNHVARDLADPRYASRTVEEKRAHKLDEIHIREAAEELVKPDPMEFYWEDNPHDENMELVDDYEFYKTLGLSSR